MAPGTDEICAVLRLEKTDHDHLAHFSFRPDKVLVRIIARNRGSG
jgi:hypothetical protein